jgi:SAM-dependent methyltransferase
MSEIQEKAAKQTDASYRHYMELSASVAKLIPRKDIDALTDNSGPANELFHRLMAQLNVRPDEADIARLNDHARVPGMSRPWYHPKRWTASVLRLFLARQETFNLEVVRRLGELEQARHFGLLFELTTRLLGAVNTFVQQTMLIDRTIETWARGMVTRICEIVEDPSFIERYKPEQDSGASHEDKAAPAQPAGAMTAIEWAEIRAAAAAAADITALRENLAEATSSLTRNLEALATRLQITETMKQEDRDALKAMAERVSATEKRLTERIAGLTGMLQTAAPQPPQPSVAPTTARPTAPLPPRKHEFDFLSFEALTRGMETTIASEERKYVGCFEGASNVLDGGCGRGEFLELLRDAGIDASGIDMDSHMVAHCRGKGLRVAQSDLATYLRRVADGSLGGLFLGQVVEHLPREVLAELPALAFDKLRPGAAIVMETINPTCLTTFSGAFYADPTHQRPLHPKALEFLLGSAGFEGISVIFSAPVPDDEKLAPVKEKSPLEPVIKDVVLQVNANLDRLNSVLYSYGNYAIVARKPVKA